MATEAGFPAIVCPANFCTLALVLQITFFFSHIFTGLFGLAWFLSDSQALPEQNLIFWGFLPCLFFTTIPTKVNQYIQNKNTAMTGPTETTPKILPKSSKSWCSAKIWTEKFLLSSWSSTMKLCTIFSNVVNLQLSPKM